MKTKLEELRKEIIKSNPDIVEIKLGIKVSDGYIIGRVVSCNSEKKNSEVTSVIISRKPFYEEHATFQAYETDFLKENFEIIGRDINLDDILKCYKEVFRKNYGGIFRTEANLLEVLSVWELGKPLHEQSEATINVLHNLICIKSR